jgi:outer membrane protein assembly factor BamB
VGEGHEVAAFDLATGEVIWRNDLESSMDTTAAFADGRIHLVADGALYVLDSTDGDRIWSLEFGENIPNLAPAVQGDQIFVAGTEFWAVHEGSSAAQESKGVPAPSPPSVLGSLLGVALFLRGRTESV